MRVVITTGIFPPDIGGPATHADDLSTELRDRGHQVVVLTLGDSARTVRGPDLVRHPRAWPWPRRAGAAAGWLVRNRRAYDVVYATGLDLPAVAGALLARRPVVLKVVGDPAWERGARQGLTTATFTSFQDQRGGPARLRAMRAARSWTVRRATAVVTPSACLRDVVRGWVGGTRVPVVVPNGARPNPHRRGVRPREETPPQAGLRALYVGRLVAHKRVDVVIDALAEVEGVTLDIVGEGPDQPSLQARVRDSNLGHRVSFLGPLSREDTLERLAAADVLVNASGYEGLPHVAVEALVAGVPVVASTAGGTVEVVEHERNGLLVPSDDPSAFAAALARLRDEPGLLAELALGACETGEGWRFDRCAERVEALLESIVGRGRRPKAVFVGRGIPLPPSDELLRKFAIHGRLLRQVSVTTGTAGLWSVGGVRVLAFRRLRPPLLGGLLFYAGAPLVAVPLALGRRSAIVCQSPYEALGVLLLVRLLPGRARPAVQIELHGDWRTAPRLYGHPSRSLLGPACDRLCSWAIRRADRVRVVSEALGDQARAAGYAGPIDRHVTFSDFSAFLADEPVPPPVTPRAVFIGVLERYKAIDRLVEAWPEVVERVPEAELVVVGEGTLGPDLRRRVEEQGIRNLRFQAPMPQHQLVSLLDDATCLVLPSRSEGLPRVVMEAMARGRAVVASDVGGMRELVDDGTTGRLVPPEDVLALAEALADVLSDPALAQQMGREARVRAEQRDPAREYEAGIERLAAWIDAR